MRGKFLSELLGVSIRKKHSTSNIAAEFFQGGRGPLSALPSSRAIHAKIPTAAPAIPMHYEGSEATEISLTSLPSKCGNTTAVGEHHKLKIVYGAPSANEFAHRFLPVALILVAMRKASGISRMGEMSKTPSQFCRSQ